MSLSKQKWKKWKEAKAEKLSTEIIFL